MTELGVSLPRKYVIFAVGELEMVVDDHVSAEQVVTFCAGISDPSGMIRTGVGGEYAL